MSEGLSRGRLVLATAGVMLALLLASLDQTIVGTAMPRIVAELKGLDYYAWVTTAYLVTSTTMVPIAGKLGDLFGRKPFLLVGMIGFVVASLLCGQSADMFQLVVFRGIQGLFGGLLFASVFSVLGDLFRPDQRARMQGLFGAVFGVSSILGPILGGYITDNLTWRWVFYVNLPVGLLGVAVVLYGLPYVRSKASWRDIDFLGAGVLAAGLVPLLIGLSITRDHGWTDPLVLSLLLGGAILLVAFFLIEQRVREPIVPFHLFKNNVFAVSMVVGFLTAAGMFGALIFVPLDFQGVLGVSVTNSGLLLTPMMVGLIGASAITGFAMTRIRRYRYLGTAGVAIMMVGLYMLAQVGVNTSQFQVTVDILIIGAGLGMTFPLYINAVQAALPKQYLGVGSSQVQFWRNMGGTIAIAVMGSVLTKRLPENMSAEIAKLHLPPGFKLPNGGSSSPQALFDPAHLAALKHGLPPQAAALVDQIIHASRVALATTLHEMFMYTLLVLAGALVATLFMREVPMTSMRRPVPPEEVQAGTPVAAP
jgi:EmrB/QacA subfamily drug resistance transporter